ncbi:MAG: DUF4097 domain-containing protein [Ignavibacteria bacterium]|jgi:hypothetical protein|nr:DUF4097 domain-containing protein [Ignavibacteria bacterium]MCU7504392.1 DUF4097 domain-containing protein [Ignavibacteria bacterium]MCU7518167.1 DUF4097 domain-containing protein [Ignavibacteria bacterium]
MKKLLSTALLLAFGFSASFAADASSLASNGINFMFFWGFPSKDKKCQEQTVQKEFKVPKGQTLTVDLKTGGAIKISGWDKELVSVCARFEGKNWQDCNVEFDEKDNGVSINSKYNGASNTWSASCDLEIKVPDKFDLSLYTMGGDIELRNIEGRFSGKTLGGKLKLDHLKGYLELKTLGGGIDLTDSDVDGRVETLGGPVDIRNVTGNIKGPSMGGVVRYSNVSHKGSRALGDGKTEADGEATGKSSGEVRISSMGGSINVEEAPQGAELSTMGGAITVNKAKQYVEAKTMGGDIKIMDIDGRVIASTMAGNVEVNLTGSGDGHDVKISSLSGDITLVVPMDLSMDVDVKLNYTESREGEYKIISDFSLQQNESDEWDDSQGTPRKQMTGTGSFNGGKNKITIETINGNVYLKKRG